MRAVGRLPKVLFFIDGMVPSQEEQDEANSIAGTGKQVSMRNAQLVDPVGAAALEECDAVAGKVPPRYAAIYTDEAPGNISGVGALRYLHDGEPGVNETNALHLNSTSTGVPIEEEKRRAYRGLSINEQGGGVSTDPALTVKSQPRAEGTGPEGGTNSDTTGPVMPGAGWTTAAGGEPGFAGMPASHVATKLTGDPALGGVGGPSPAGEGVSGAEEAAGDAGKAPAGAQAKKGRAAKPEADGEAS